jgi:hypothetical protein
MYYLKDNGQSHLVNAYGHGLKKTAVHPILPNLRFSEHLGMAFDIAAYKFSYSKIILQVRKLDGARSRNHYNE